MFKFHCKQSHNSFLQFKNLIFRCVSMHRQKENLHSILQFSMNRNKTINFKIRYFPNLCEQQIFCKLIFNVKQNPTKIEYETFHRCADRILISFFLFSFKWYVLFFRMGVALSASVFSLSISLIHFQRWYNFIIQFHVTMDGSCLISRCFVVAYCCYFY